MTEILPAAPDPRPYRWWWQPLWHRHPIRFALVVLLVIAGGVAWGLPVGLWARGELYPPKPPAAVVTPAPTTPTPTPTHTHRRRTYVPQPTYRPRPTYHPTPTPTRTHRPSPRPTHTKSTPPILCPPLCPSGSPPSSGSPSPKPTPKTPKGVASTKEAVSPVGWFRWISPWKGLW